MSNIPYNTSNPNAGFNLIENFENINSPANVVFDETTGHFKINNSTTLTSVCPHNGCRLNYNKNEQKFVCPCHNSKFNLNGKCLQGPACPNSIKL